MNKANFTFFHLNGIKRSLAALSLILGFAAFTNVSAQTVTCNGHLNVAVNPNDCFARIMPDAFGLHQPTANFDREITLSGIDADDWETTQQGGVIIYSTPDDDGHDGIPAFMASGIVEDITYSYNVIGPATGTIVNSCWGTLTLEDKAAPTITCPDVTVMSCADYDEATAWGWGDNWGDYIEECTSWELSDAGPYQVSDISCVSETWVVDFTVTDVRGNYATCSQEITLTAETLDNLELPDNYDGLGSRTVIIDDVDYLVYDGGTLACDEADTDGGWATLPNGNPNPDDVVFNKGKSNEYTAYGTGYPSGIGTCGTIHAAYEDLNIDVCADDCEQSSPSFKVVRTWTILNWCTGEVLEHNQIIKVIDDEAPTFGGLPDVTVSTDLWGCGATYVLPTDSSVKDNCSNEIEAVYSAYSDDFDDRNPLGAVGTIVNGVLYIPEGHDVVTVYVDYYDCCGNTDFDYFYIWIHDQVPPVVVADAHTVVSLSQYNDSGLAKVFAETFDDGSFDGCSDIGMYVRRMPGEPLCAGYESEDGDIPTVIQADGTKVHSGNEDLFFDWIHFCCEDIQFDDAGEQIPIMVQFMVCDDATGDGITEAGGKGHGHGGGLSASAIKGGDNCNTAMVEVIVQDKLPPVCAAPSDMSISCIDVVAYQDLIGAGALDADGMARVNARFGAPTFASTCANEISQTLSSTEDCGLGTVTRVITVKNLVNGKSSTCTQKIEITYDSETNFLSCYDITFPTGSAEDDLYREYILKKYGNKSAFYPNYVWCLMNPEDIDNADGTESFDGEDLPAIEVNDCAGVTITAPEVDIDDLCSEVGINLTVDTFDFAGGGCKKILAHWEIIDQCRFVDNYLYYNGDEYEINPFVAENGYFEMYVEYDLFDTEGPVITCGEGQVVGCGEDFASAITASASDNCTDPEFFGWSWKLDVGADNTFDFSGQGNSIVPGDIVVDGKPLTSFPEGNHAVTWIVSDGCGNISQETCEFGLSQEDNKAPTPYCYDGLSSAVMLMGGVELWASDFDAGSFDLCSDVTVTMIPESDTEGLSAQEAYEASAAGWTFGCDYIANGVAATIDVRIYATDASGNYDFCTASFRLQDNLDGCEDSEGGLAAIGGNVATEDADMVSDVEVEAMASNPEFPKYTNTGNDGNYAFYSNPSFYNYELTASKNSDYSNGVSTLDLVIIQKHILNVESLDSPYKRIAADINNDASIKASDLIQLRKLILGLYTNDRLPSNDSWRFVDANFAFADAAQPWPFDEVVNVDNLATDMMSENFVAVKVGDVNGTVQANANMNAAPRTNNNVTFELDNASYAAGEIVELNFRSSDFNEVYGYQFTLEFGKDLTFAGIDAGALNVTEANFGLNKLSEGVITTSFDDVTGATKSADEVLFTVRFNANNPVELKDAVSISSRYTAAEAYVGAGLTVNGVDVAFRTGEGTELANTYALYQNEPNPFRGVTNVSFNLPEAANATISVYDVTGKVIYKNTASYAKGLNTVKLSNLSASGVLYYQLDSDDFTATKKMIIIE